MPYTIRKLPRKDLYRVINSQTGQVHSAATTKPKAEAQVRLLRSIASYK